MIKTILLSFFAIFLFMQPLAAEKIKIGGSSTVTNFVFDGNHDLIARQTEQDFNVVTSSSGRGLLALENGTADIGMISSEIESLIEKLNKSDNDLDINDYNIHKINEIGVLYVVHPSNPLVSLTGEQVRDIFTGKITSWEDVGVEDLGSIKVVTEHPTGGVYNTLVKKALNGEDFVDDKIVMQNAPQVALVISQLPNAFGFLSDATPEYQRKTSKILQVPDLDVKQKMFFVTKKDEQRTHIQSFILKLQEMF